jgi:hypothetical protein
MNDYSEVTATLQRRIVGMNDSLSKKKYSESLTIAVGIVKDMIDIIVWLSKQDRR